MAKTENGTTQLVPYTDSEIMALASDKAVATLQAVLEDNLGGSAKVFDFPALSVPAGGAVQWAMPTLDGDDESTGEIRAVILTIRSVRAYYDSTYDGGSAPPTCSSPDTVTGYGEPGGECISCLKAQFGTAKDGTAGGQACSERKHVMFLPLDSLLPMFLNLPVTSAKPLQRYAMLLGGKGLMTMGVVTGIGLRKTKNSGGIDYSEATFKCLGVLAPDELARAKAYAEVLKGIMYANEGGIRNVTPTPAVAAEA